MSKKPLTPEEVAKLMSEDEFDAPLPPMGGPGGEIKSELPPATPPEMPPETPITGPEMGPESEDEKPVEPIILDKGLLENLLNKCAETEDKESCKLIADAALEVCKEKTAEKPEEDCVMTVEEDLQKILDKLEAKKSTESEKPEELKKEPEDKEGEGKKDEDEKDKDEPPFESHFKKIDSADQILSEKKK